MKAAVNAIVFILKCMPIRKSNFKVQFRDELKSKDYSLN